MASTGTASPAPQLLRLPAVLERVGLGRSRVYDLIQHGRFPRPVRLSDRAIAWDSDEITAWIRERIAARDAEAA